MRGSPRQLCCLDPDEALFALFIAAEWPKRALGHARYGTWAPYDAALEVDWEPGA